MFMPWEETEEYIRSGHRSSDEFEKGSMRTIVISQEKGIKAIVGCPKGHFHDERCEQGMNVLSFLFAKENGWTMSKAKKWFEENKK
jgi:hypothetical protein